VVARGTLLIAQSARTLGLLRSEMAASAGFPDQANNFPDGPI